MTLKEGDQNTYGTFFTLSSKEIHVLTHTHVHTLNPPFNKEKTHTEARGSAASCTHPDQLHLCGRIWFWFVKLGLACKL